MTKDKLNRQDGYSFNLNALEKLGAKKTRSVRPSRPVDYHETRAISKPGKKFDPLKQSNPWLGGPADQSGQKPYVPKKPDLKNASLEKKYPVKEAEAPVELTASGPAPTQDAVTPEDDSKPAPVSIEQIVSSDKDEKPRIVKSVKEQSSSHIEKKKVNKASRFTDETIRKIVSDKTAKKKDKKNLRVEVEPFCSVVAGAVGKSIGGVVDTGKTVAGAARSGAQAAANTIETGVKDAVGAIKQMVKPGSKPSGAGSEEKVADDSPISSSIKTAASITGKVADGVLAAGSGVGKITGYVVKGAVAAPVDIASGVSGVIVNTASAITRLFQDKKQIGEKK